MDAANLGERCTLNGSLIFQNILRFSSEFIGQNPALNSYILSMDANILRLYATNKMLSRSLEAIFTSHISKEAKKQVFDRLMESSGSVVCQNIYGCRVVETAYHLLDPSSKASLRGVVQKDLDSIMANKWGRIMYAKLRLDRNERQQSKVAKKKRSILEIFDSK